MSGLSSPRHRHRIVAFAALPALVGVALLAWLLFGPPPHLLCRLEQGDLRAPSPLGGLTLGALPAAHGLVVTSLRSHGPAEQNGVRVGDVIEAVDGHNAGSLTMLNRILRTDAHPTVSVRMRNAMGRYDVLLTRTPQVCRDP